MIKIIVIGIIALLLFRLQRRVYQELWNKSLVAKVEFTSAGCFEGEEGELLEIIENRKRLPLPLLRVKFQTSRNLEFTDMENSRVTDKFYHKDVFRISGGEKITRTIKFIARKRGYYKIDSIDLVASDLFLTTEMVESKKTDCYFYVYPKPLNSRELKVSLKQLNGEVITKRHLLEDPFEYRGIREYQPFDDIRMVNWKATAKTDELKVNQKNYTALQMVRIFFNVEDTGIWKKDDAVEGCFKIVAGLAENFLSQGIGVAVYGNGVDMIGGNPVVLDSSAGTGQMERIYKALARVDTSKPAVSFVETFGERFLNANSSIQTFIVAPNVYEDFANLLKEFQESGHDYVWFYPTWDLEDPQLDAWLKPHVRVLHIR